MREGGERESPGGRRDPRPAAGASAPGQPAELGAAAGSALGLLSRGRAAGAGRRSNKIEKTNKQTCPPRGGGGVGGTVAVPEQLSGRVRGCRGCAGCRTAARLSLKGLLQRCLSSKDIASEVILLLFFVGCVVWGHPFRTLALQVLNGEGLCRSL